MWVVGSCFKQILTDFPGVWGPGDDAERLREAHETFKSWTHRHRIPILYCRLQLWHILGVRILLCTCLSNYLDRHIVLNLYFALFSLNHSPKPQIDARYRNTQPRFTTASLKSPDGPYPELRAKAYNAAQSATNIVTILLSWVLRLGDLRFRKSRI